MSRIYIYFELYSCYFRLEAGRYVSGVTGAIFKGYDSEEEAVDAFNEAFRAGHVRVVPDVNNVLNRVSFTVAAAKCIINNHILELDGYKWERYTSSMSRRWIGLAQYGRFGGFM